MFNKIMFPIIAFPKIGEKLFIEPIRFQEDITHTYLKPYRNGYFNDLTLVDSEGNVFRVSHANKLGYRGFFGLIHSQIKVELIFNATLESISLDAFKSKLTKYLKMENDFWSSGDNFNEILSFIKSAKNHREIIEYLTKYFYKEY
jgi:hypothetical protein